MTDLVVSSLLELANHALSRLLYLHGLLMEVVGRWRWSFAWSLAFFGSSVEMNILKTIIRYFHMSKGHLTQNLGF